MFFSTTFSMNTGGFGASLATINSYLNISYKFQILLKDSAGFKNMEK